MKQFILLSLLTISFTSHTMLLLEDAFSVYKRNAEYVAQACNDCLKLLYQLHPDIPKGLYRRNVKKIAESLISPEDAKVVLQELNKTKLQIGLQLKRKNEENEILKMFGIE